MELFHAQGYQATGLAQILKQAGVNSGSLYHFFNSKEELLLAVLDRYREMLRPVLLQPIVEGCPDPVERVFALLEFYRQALIRSEFAYGCPIGNLALELREFHPRAHDLIAANFQGWREAVCGWLEEAADRFPPSLDRERLASFVLTAMEGAVMQCRSYRSIEPFEQAVALLRDYLDRLLAEGSASAGAPAPETEKPG
jgi:TetR/AcrR family transcriptional regulator, transcriptional repressor for nem operon